MLLVVSAPKYTLTLKKSVGHAVSHLLHPMQSSVLGAEAICPALHPGHSTISKTSHGQARTHWVQPIHVSYTFTLCAIQGINSLFI